MIARITGRLEQIADAAALIDTGDGMVYEVLIPAAIIEPLSRRVGQEVCLHTIHYLEGDPSRGSQMPRLVGFLAEEDRRFFRLFTTVKGVGIRKALRALARPVSEVASAIASEDAKLLTTLPEIGKRTAELIIAELSGKVDSYAGPVYTIEQADLPEAAAEAVAVLVQLGEKRSDATELVRRVMAVAPDEASPETIIQHVYKIKAGGR